MSGWTEERIDLAVRLFKEGQSAGQVAKKLGGISRSAVLGKLWRLGHKRAAPARPARAPKPERPARVRTQRASPQPTLVSVVLPVAAFEPLPDSAPRPWERRGSGCNWPVGDGLSCCEPVHARGWCATHHALGSVPLKPAQKNLARALRRWVA